MIPKVPNGALDSTAVLGDHITPLFAYFILHTPYFNQCHASPRAIAAMWLGIVYSSSFVALLVGGHCIEGVP